MAELKTFPVYGENGKQVGTVRAATRFLDDSAEKTVRLNDGREVMVEAEALEVRGDGSFYLKKIAETLNDTAAEEPFEDGDMHMVAATPEAPAAFPESMTPKNALFQNGYDIRTVPVGKLLDAPVEQRQEGDVFIFPVVEEVWVVEKKQYLREEIHITKKKQPVDRVRTIDRTPAL
jgi:Domain of unknown function (DUF2382)